MVGQDVEDAGVVEASGTDALAGGRTRRRRPLAPDFPSKRCEPSERTPSPLVAELRWLSRPDRRDTEVDAEAIPLARSLRWLRGETLIPSEDEIALDDAFVAVRWAEERAVRNRVARRIAGAVAMLAAVVAVMPLAKDWLP